MPYSPAQGPYRQRSTFSTSAKKLYWYIQAVTLVLCCIQLGVLVEGKDSGIKFLKKGMHVPFPKSPQTIHQPPPQHSKDNETQQGGVSRDTLIMPTEMEQLFRRRHPESVSSRLDAIESEYKVKLDLIDALLEQKEYTAMLSEVNALIRSVPLLRPVSYRFMELYLLIFTYTM